MSGFLENKSGKTVISKLKSRAPYAWGGTGDKKVLPGVKSFEPKRAKIKKVLTLSVKITL